MRRELFTLGQLNSAFQRCVWNWRPKGGSIFLDEIGELPRRDSDCSFFACSCRNTNLSVSVEPLGSIQDRMFGT